MPEAASKATETITELVEVIPVRYIVLALIVGAAVTFGAMYIIGQRMNAEVGTDDGSGTEQ